jgi:TolA-binding protein
MLARMDALDGQIARLTAQVEESGNKVSLLEGRLAKLEVGAVPAATGSGTIATPAPAATAAVEAPKPAAVVKPPVTTTKSAPATASATRIAAVRAVEKPATADPGDDEYSFGFRLWEAKLYPEAEQQLKLFLQKYPKHAKNSHARNLLGRAYLDEGNLDEAGKWFYENYKADRGGARAPDSVLYLAETWQRKKDTNRVCIALAQFVDDYPAEAGGRLRGQYEGLRGKVKCN